MPADRACHEVRGIFPAFMDISIATAVKTEVCPALRADLLCICVAPVLGTGVFELEYYAMRWLLKLSLLE